VFHVSKLMKVTPNDEAKFPNRVQNPPPVGYVRGQGVYEVEAITNRQWMQFEDKKGKKMRPEWGWLIKWKGYEEHDNSWERIAHLKNARDLVDEYNRRHPAKRGEPKLPEPLKKRPLRAKRRSKR
jgi:Chromo (CHRromatin Organisation MOdifier) domain